MGKLCLHAVLMTEKLPFERRRGIMGIDGVRACKQCSDPTFSTTSRRLTRSARSDIEKQRNTYTKRLYSHTVKTFAFLYDTFSCRSQCSKVMLGFSSTYIISILHQNISSLLFRCDLMLIGGYCTRLSTIVSPGVLAH